MRFFRGLQVHLNLYLVACQDKADHTPVTRKGIRIAYSQNTFIAYFVDDGTDFLGRRLRNIKNVAVLQLFVGGKQQYANRPRLTGFPVQHFLQRLAHWAITDEPYGQLLARVRPLHILGQVEHKSRFHGAFVLRLRR